MPQSAGLSVSSLFRTEEAGSRTESRTCSNDLIREKVLRLELKHHRDLDAALPIISSVKLRVVYLRAF
jgi:hypothetical protein